jgi:hypothetical protein
MVVDAGGPDDKSQTTRIIKFPAQDSNETAVRVEGDKAVVEKIVAAIKAFVEQKENTTTDTLEVAPEKHRRLIGRDGETRKGIESQFNVSFGGILPHRMYTVSAFPPVDRRGEKEKLTQRVRKSSSGCFCK